LYIFQVERDGDIEYLSQRFEWCGRGISPQIDNPDLKRVPLEEAGFGRWGALLRKGKPVFGDIEDFPSSERPLLESQDIKSLLVQPILVSGVWWGFLGLDSCKTTQSWERFEVDQLRIVSLLLGAAIDCSIQGEQLLRAQRLEVLGRMSSGVAHDFNNVLLVISGAVDLLQGALNSSPVEITSARGSCSMIEQALDRARTLTRRLLDFSKRRSGRPIVVSPLDLLKKEEPLLRGSLRSSIRLDIVAGDLSRPIAPVLIDPTEFAQLALNVTVNANDAMTHEGELRFEVSTPDPSDPSLELDTIPAGQWSLIRVSDSGVGMPPEVLAHAFEPFYSTKPDDKGTGLGLSTVSSIVAAVGGYVRVSSILGRGTEFRFYLPALTGDAAPTA
jgi:signal transduction histidine kinase